MTLREQLLKGYRGDVNDIFNVEIIDEETEEKDILNPDHVAMMAESLTAEEFAQILNVTSLSLIPKQLLIQKFKEYVKETYDDSILFEDLPELMENDKKTFNHPYTVVNNGVLKKKLIYNDNYEPRSEDDFD